MGEGRSCQRSPVAATDRAGRQSNSTETERTPMKLVTTITLALALSIAPAFAEQQTRFYGPDGKSIGTAVPQGQGSVRYYDARGNSMGVSTTAGGTTTFYGPGGNVTGRASMPGATMPSFQSGRR
jgi:hypothetical protein